MPSTRSRPWWQHRSLITLLAVVLLVVLMFKSTTFVGADEVLADTGEEYAEEAYESTVVPTIEGNAIDLGELAGLMAADPDGTGEEHGSREDDNKPYSFSVSASGKVVEGSFGEIGLETDGLGDLTAGVAVPPLGSSTALRDAGTDLTFGDFVNQTEFQNAAMELNKKAAEIVYADIAADDLIGKSIEVVGAVTWSSKTGGAVDHLTIVPVSIEAEP